mmetsp:Transcript_2607/g.8330  ORF Transcript_2607/g.8330 Transcript_2607/m.8330 type:complete len:328 (-) Transcript_2607:1985-2968(-)
MVLRGRAWRRRYKPPRPGLQLPVSHVQSARRVVLSRGGSPVLDPPPVQHVGKLTGELLARVRADSADGGEDAEDHILEHCGHLSGRFCREGSGHEETRRLVQCSQENRLADLFEVREDDLPFLLHMGKDTPVSTPWRPARQLAGHTRLNVRHHVGLHGRPAYPPTRQVSHCCRRAMRRDLSLPVMETLEDAGSGGDRRVNGRVGLLQQQDLPVLPLLLKGHWCHWDGDRALFHVLHLHRVVARRRGEGREMVQPHLGNQVRALRAGRPVRHDIVRPLDVQGRQVILGQLHCRAADPLVGLRVRCCQRCARLTIRDPEDAACSETQVV